jgi:hypothetical protein
MPENRQIGRSVCIAKLEGKLTTPAHQWLIGERRIGKTSVAKAALARLRQRGSVTVDIDLSKLQLTTTQELAGEMARQGQAAGAGDHAAASRLFGFAKKHKGQAKGLGDLLQQLGFENEGEALVAVSAVLAEADDGTPGLQRVLGAIALHARATERRAYVLLDEIHLLAAIDQAQEGISRWCHEAGSPIVFIFAGSEESAAQALRESDQPMAAIGEEFELSEIAPEDWIPGLRSRFAEAGVKIERSELETILQASGCHPRRTMLVASRVRATALMSPARIATPTEVELSIQEARKDRSWR